MMKAIEGLFPCIAITSSGGQIQWRRIKVSWLNSLPPGCQLLGPAYWGRTTVSWGPASNMQHNPSWLWFK
jgi:hypothetical protein